MSGVRAGTSVFDSWPTSSCWREKNHTTLSNGRPGFSALMRLTCVKKQLGSDF